MRWREHERERKGARVRTRRMENNTDRYNHGRACWQVTKKR